jgi:hypothetical protein
MSTRRDDRDAFLLRCVAVVALILGVWFDWSLLRGAAVLLLFLLAAWDIRELMLRKLKERRQR